MTCLILFPHQLFEQNKYDHVILWEHDYFFTRLCYHKLKLCYHRATMRSYNDKYNVSLYIENKQIAHKIIHIYINDHSIKQLTFFNPIEKELCELIASKKLITGCKLEHVILPSPYFLNDFIDTVPPTHAVFYKAQRIKYAIMISKNNDTYIPDGGKWSYDTDNRGSFAKGQKDIRLMLQHNDDYINEAILYVNKNYPNNYGTCEKINFVYPINRKDSLKWLSDFIKRKLSLFGKYEDAMSSKVVFGYHSVLSPMLNIGLITPMDIISKILKLKDDAIPLASKEGFIRQVIGWREYSYQIYNDGIVSSFYNKATRRVPAKLWAGKTQICIIDNVIANVNKYAYSHHIERLMCIGNFMIMLGISSEEIYKWFSIMYIDAYDVFMIPNVFGMLLYGTKSNGHHMMTKPYLCASNYLKKMSDYNYTEDNVIIDDAVYKWDYVIDALYYNTIHIYSDKLSKLNQAGFSVRRFNKFPADKQKELLKVARDYIKWIYS